jgi:hypothetical protein
MAAISEEEEFEFRRRAEAEAATAAKPQRSLMGAVGEGVGNVPGQVKDLLYGAGGAMANAAMHPDQALYNAGEAITQAPSKAMALGQALGQQMRNLSPAELQGSAPKMDTKPAEAAEQGVFERYGFMPGPQREKPAFDKQKLYRTLATDPVGAAVEVGSVAYPAARAGNLTGKLGDALMSAPKAAAAPSVAELKAQARTAYKTAEDAGVVIKSQNYASFSDGLTDRLKAEGIDKDLHPKASAVLGRIKAVKGDVGLKDLETLRRLATDASTTIDKSDRRFARVILDEIDDYAEKLEPHNVAAGNAPEAVGALKEARSAWRRSAKGEKIESLIDKAKTSAGAFNVNLDEALRREFRKLANNERGIARFSPFEQAAIKKVAKGEPWQNVMYSLGKLAPTSKWNAVMDIALIGGSHMAGAGPVAGAAVALGLPAKAGSAVISSKNAKLASELARRGGPAPAPPPRPAPTPGRPLSAREATASALAAALSAPPKKEPAR